MAKKKAAASRTPTGLKRPPIKRGETYIGAVIGANGKGHHVILLPGDQQGTWDEMMAWAKKQNGDLPDRVEQALLFRDHAAKFEKAYYWSNTPLAHDAGFAWLQSFSFGYQFLWHMSNTLRARAVRRLPI